jgi:hypothetical protein
LGRWRSCPVATPHWDVSPRSDRPGFGGDPNRAAHLPCQKGRSEVCLTLVGCPGSPILTKSQGAAGEVIWLDRWPCGDGNGKGGMAFTLSEAVEVTGRSRAAILRALQTASLPRPTETTDEWTEPVLKGTIVRPATVDWSINCDLVGISVALGSGTEIDLVPIGTTIHVSACPAISSSIGQAMRQITIGQ